MCDAKDITYFYYISLTNQSQKAIQILIYFLIKVAPITFIVTSNCKFFLSKIYNSFIIVLMEIY